MSWNHWGTELIDIELIACETAAACICSSRCCRKLISMFRNCFAASRLCLFNRFDRLFCPDCGVLNVIGLFQIFHVHLCNIHMCCLHQMKYSSIGLMVHFITLALGRLSHIHTGRDRIDELGM